MGTKTLHTFLKQTDGCFSSWSPATIMASCCDLSLPLALLCLLVIRGLSAPQASSGPPTTIDPFLQPEDYSDDQYPDVTSAPMAPHSTRTRPSERCDYNPCVENQTPCQQLAATRGCRCPGTTLAGQVPLPPELRSLSWNGSQVVVRWCAPYSNVNGYLATVGGVKRGEFGTGQRSAGLGAVDDKTEVCLYALNAAGVSEAVCRSYRYDGRGGRGLMLTLVLVGGALGLLMLLLPVILLWRRRRQRKQWDDGTQWTGKARVTRLDPGPDKRPPAPLTTTPTYCPLHPGRFRRPHCC